MDVFTNSAIGESLSSVQSFPEASVSNLSATTLQDEDSEHLQGQTDDSPIPISLAGQVLGIEKDLSADLSQLSFSPPVAYVYNPLSYAWETHCLFVSKYCSNKKKILFVGMNPGPWGMAQTGIPFGEVRAVQDWLGIIGTVGQPPMEHPQRRIQGFQCPRTEVSGQRFWGFFRDLCVRPENMFKDTFVYSYCPLSFMHSSARNITPPELKSCDRQAIMALCDAALAKIITTLQVSIVIGIGKFAEYRIRETVKKSGLSHVTIGCILHPSPINPAANKGWKEAVLKSMIEMNILHIVRGNSDNCNQQMNSNPSH